MKKYGNNNIIATLPRVIYFLYILQSDQRFHGTRRRLYEGQIFILCVYWSA